MPCPVCGLEGHGAACARCGAPLVSPGSTPGQASMPGHQAQPAGYGWYGSAPATPEPLPRAEAAPAGWAEGSWADVPVAGTPVGAPGVGAWAASPVAEAPVPAATGKAPGRGKGSRRTLLAIALAAVVLVAGGGLAGAAWFFGWFGGKSPADVLPGTAMAYVRVDLNPSMAQKTAMLQFFRDLPEVEDATAGGGGATDPRKILWDQVRRLDYSGMLDDIRYSSDIEPWLGDKAGLAVVPREGGVPIVVGAVQVTDSQKAAEGLARLLEDGPISLDITIRDGYALITNADDTDLVLEDIQAGTLAQQAVFSDPMRALGDTGIASGWADLDAYGEWFRGMLETQGQSGGIYGALDEYQGQTAMALRFTADTAELAGVARGTDPELSGSAFKTRGLGDLPAGVGAAMNLQGGADLLPAVWDRLEEFYRANGMSLDDALSGSGMGRDDIASLVGRSLTVAFPSPEELMPGQSDSPEVGAVVVGDDPDLAQENVERLLEDQLSNGYLELHDSVDGDTYVAATSRSLQQDLAEPGDRLSGVEKFTKAVPDAGQASVAAYLDLESLTPFARDYAEEYWEFISSLRSAGMTTRVTGSGQASFSARLVRS